MYLCNTYLIFVVVSIIKTSLSPIASKVYIIVVNNNQHLYIYLFLPSIYCHSLFLPVLPQLWQKFVESQPVRFSDRELFPLMIRTVTRVAKFLGIFYYCFVNILYNLSCFVLFYSPGFYLDCDKKDIVFVQNATTGTNSVIQSFVKTLQPGDEILMTNFTYGKVSQP